VKKQIHFRKGRAEGESLQTTDGRALKGTTAVGRGSQGAEKQTGAGEKKGKTHEIKLYKAIGHGERDTACYVGGWGREKPNTNRGNSRQITERKKIRNPKKKGKVSGRPERNVLHAD